MGRSERSHTREAKRMNRRLIIQESAEREMAGAAVWYRKQHIGLELDLLAEFRVALKRAVLNTHQFVPQRASRP